MGYQQIIIQGNLSRDAEVRQVGQSQVAKTSVAVTEKYRKADGTVTDSTEYFDLEIWDKVGVYPYLKKGASVFVVGSQKTDKWQDQGGQNREQKKVRVQVIQLCGSKPTQAQPQGASPQSGYAPQPQSHVQSSTQRPATPPTYQQTVSAPPQMPPAQPQFPQAQPQYPTQGGYQSNDPDLPF